MRKQLPRLLMYALVVFLASIGTVFSVTTAFDISVNGPVIVLVCAVTSLLFTSCFFWKKALLLLIPGALLVVLAAIITRMFAPVAPTAQQLAHDILARFSSAYPNISFIIPPEPEAYLPQSMTLLFTLVGVLLTVWMAWGVGYRSCLITVAGSLPFLLLCVIINDTPPSAAPLVLLLSALLTVLLCKERPDEPPSMDTARLGITLMAVLLLLSVIGTVYPKEDTRDRELPQLIQDILDQLPEPIQDMLSREGDGFKDEELGADTSEILDLTTQGTRDRKDTVMMQLSSTETGILYLRGAAKDIYTGTSWESKNGTSSAQSVYAHTSLGTAFGMTQAAIQIKNYQDDTSVAFVPYGFISCSGADTGISDLRIPCSEDDYIIYYWPGLKGLDLMSPAGSYNPDYDQYVLDNCLELPEGVQETLYDLALSYGYDPSLSTLDTIAWVAEFIRTVGSYRLDVSRQPANYDFAVYFLTESREGYCVHFATAAAAMYRALGIPARYASGYRVSVKEASQVTDVTDMDTHAWAEIYLSGLGWLPVETTPGFGSTLTLPEVEHQPEPTAAPEPSEEPAEPSPSQEPQDQTPSPSPSPAAPSEQPDGPAPSETPQAAVPPGASATTGLLFLLIPLGLVVLLVLLALVLTVRRTLVLSRRAKRFRDRDNNQAVIFQWQYLERLVPYGAELPKELEALALKAKFSQHAISDEERTAFSQAVRTLSADTRAQLGGWRKFRFGWLSCLTLKK